MRLLARPLLLANGIFMRQSVRTAIILKRVHDPPILGPYATKYQIDQQVFLDDKYRRYEVEEEDDEANSDNELIKVILLKSMEEYGRRGQIISYPRPVALKELLLPKLAVYASPYNLDKYRDILIPEGSVQYSSDTAQQLISKLSCECFAIVMSSETQWTLEPWHVQMAMRHKGVHVEDSSAIHLPTTTKICGPDSTLSGKEFVVNLDINGCEKLPLRCVIFQRSAAHEVQEEVPPPGWDVRFNEPLLEEERQQLKLLPRRKLDAKQLAQLPDAKLIMSQYVEWRSERDRTLFAS